MLYDQSGSGNDGTLGAGTAKPAWVSQGLSFTGSQIVNLTLPPLSLLTIIAALAPTSFAGTQVFIGSTATNTYDGIVAGHWSSRSSYGSVGVSLDSGNSTAPVIYASVRGPETFGSWGNGGFNLSKAQTFVPDANTLPTIGSASLPFSGLVYYQAVYDRVLNDDELFQAYQFIRDTRFTRAGLPCAQAQ